MYVLHMGLFVFCLVGGWIVSIRRSDPIGDGASVTCLPRFWSNRHDAGSCLGDRPVRTRLVRHRFTSRRSPERIWQFGWCCRCADWVLRGISIVAGDRLLRRGHGGDSDRGAPLFAFLFLSRTSLVLVEWSCTPISLTGALFCGCRWLAQRPRVDAQALEASSAGCR